MNMEWQKSVDVEVYSFVCRALYFPLIRFFNFLFIWCFTLLKQNATRLQQ